MNFWNQYSLLTLTSLTGIVAVAWQHLLWAGKWCYGLVFVQVSLKPELANLFLVWLRFQSHRQGVGAREYTTHLCSVRPLQRRAYVVFEIGHREGALYWFHRRPFYARPIVTSKQQYIGFETESVSLVLTFLRGTIDPNQLLLEALDAVNDLLHGENGEMGIRRHRITHLFGTLDESSKEASTHVTGGRRYSDHDFLTLNKHRPLRYKVEELRDVWSYDGSFGIDRLALGTEVAKVIEELEHWIKNQEWFAEHGLPWNYGVLLEGPPGNGKTSFARAVGQKFDLPIYVLHIETMYDRELLEEWEETIKANTPCCVLLEDIDAMFEKRDTVRNHALSLSTLLNCLDGVNGCDGILKIMTTNYPEKLDAALYRAGRVNRIIRFAPPDLDGRYQIARRILKSCPDYIDVIVRAGENDSGAEFENRCQERAMQQFWLSIASAGQNVEPNRSAAWATSLNGSLASAHHLSAMHGDVTSPYRSPTDHRTSETMTTLIR